MSGRVALSLAVGSVLGCGPGGPSTAGSSVLAEGTFQGVAWADDGLYALVVRLDDGLVRSSLVRMVDGEQRDVEIAGDSRCFSVDAAAPTRLPDGALSYLGQCSFPPTVPAHPDGPVAAQAWRRTPDGGWEALTPSDRQSFGLLSQSWAPDLSRAVGMTNSGACTATVTLVRGSTDNPSAGVLRSGDRSWPAEQGSRGSDDCPQGQSRSPAFSPDGRLALFVTPTGNETFPDDDIPWRITVAAGDLTGQREVGPRLGNPADLEWIGDRRLLVSADGPDGQGVYVLDLTEETMSLVAEGTAYDVAVAPDRKSFASVVDVKFQGLEVPTAKLAITPLP